MKPLMVLINPVAGKGSFRNSLAEVLEALYRGGYLPTLYFTNAPGNAVELISHDCADYEAVICIGGDGTLSEVISGLMLSETRPPLGYIPMGTANDVAATLNLPKKPVLAVERFLSGAEMPFDVGSFGGDSYFTYIAAFGAFTGVSYETPQDVKHALGQLAYLLEGMRHITRINYHRVSIEYDEGTILDDLIFGAVTNSTSIAGLVKLDEDIVELGDGLFEVILIKNPKDIFDMNNIVGDILSRKYQSQFVQVLHSRKVRFLFDSPAAWTKDGENGGLHRDITLENHRSAIRILA